MPRPLETTECYTFPRQTGTTRPFSQGHQRSYTSAFTSLQVPTFADDYEPTTPITLPQLALSQGTPSVTDDDASEDFYIDPEWDEMVTFRQLKLPYRSSTTSFLDPILYDENSSLLGHRPTSSVGSSQFGTMPNTNLFFAFLFRCTDSMVTRHILLVAFPVLVVSLWCAIPLQINTGTSDDDTKFQMHFGVFLLVYYGFYNLTALTMVSQYFHLYSFHWWPKALGAFWSNALSWCISMFLGMIIYFFTPFYKSIYTWVLLTFFTLLMPLFSAFLIIRSENRNVYRHSLTQAQKMFLLLQDNRIPSSYKRFLWFCCTLVIQFVTLFLGETYARMFTARKDPSWFDGIVYVYTWVITVFVLDFATDYIVHSRIRSWALSHIYRLYYALIYFVFYRNLFIKLRSPQEFYTVQIFSSLWVIINYPIRMSKLAHRVTTWFGSRRTYSEYTKNLGRSFFIRNLAENVSMVGFLCWINILHVGSNKGAYPYFQKFDPVSDKQTSYSLTMSASIGMWACELLSAYITRGLFKSLFGHSVTREAVKDFHRYPEVIWAMVLITIHVLQDMLLALIDLTSLS
ncbi:hypothetical protein DSO57_1028841 [Entomophthora muscae]|uniref:Uncharacterized protein n=1 Tax=Entomophthora muscae TaxID=34485 RepID=A0ACC2U056_9FUNG|nr:hypothetical protein DSO57_1028841 [Entomophthora muscae]